MALHSKKVFLASDVFIGFIDRGHPKHLHASAFFRYFAQEQFLLFTSLISVHETYQYLFEKVSPSIAKDFLKALSLGNINILFPEESDLKATYKTLLTYPNNELTFSEALMATLANKRNIPQICTFTYLHSLFGLSIFYLPL